MDLVEVDLTPTDMVKVDLTPMDMVKVDLMEALVEADLQGGTCGLNLKKY